LTAAVDATPTPGPAVKGPLLGPSEAPTTAQNSPICDLKQMGRDSSLDRVRRASHTGDDT